MSNTTFDIQALLNLKTNESIGDELAQRQLEVIRRSYEFLRQPDNNIIYIADEVGLGKTYIGIGISILLRQQSTNPSNHRDLVIVPKKNLQEKWRKEITNFVDRNYRLTDTIKHHLRDHIEVYDKLTSIHPEGWINIFRTSAFSHLATPRNKRSDLREHLVANVFPSDDFSSRIIQDAWEKGYFYKENDSLLRKLVACLLNIASSPIQCLIIDEAHNYKHGENTALRNIITSRFLGAVKDEEVLQAFPELADKMKYPLAQKVICLSATPKDRELFEIRNQFNCFTNQHILKGVTTVIDIKDRLHQFLIRGNLNYQIEGETKSRNQCRVEHRKGNISKSEDATPLILENNFESLCWQLLQYKSLKHLNTKNNASFEIGMLAGFESYKLDVERQAIKAADEAREYYHVADRIANKSQDHEVVEKIIEDYKATFEGKLPPHPKQTRMEREISQQLQEADKSLIFVRRVASAYELRKRLIHRYEDEIVYEKQLKALPQNLKEKRPVKRLIDAYLNRRLHAQLPDLLKKLVDRSDIRLYFRNLGIIGLEQQFEQLKHAFDLEGEFATLAKDYIHRKQTNISYSLRQAALRDLVVGSSTFGISNYGEDIPEEDRKSEDENLTEDFFASYFSEGRAGNVYIEKTYRESWFEIELLAFNRSLPFVIFNEKALNERLEKLEAPKKKQQVFNQRQKEIRTYWANHGRVQIGEGRSGEKPTFLTQLLTGPCYEQMKHWLQKRAGQDASVILHDLDVLGAIIKNTFRNGSGRLAGFIADASDMDFTEAIMNLLLPPDAPFRLVFREVQTIIDDFDLLMSVNFSGKKVDFVKNILKSAKSPIVVATGQDDINREMLAAQFRMPGYPYVLVTTDILREGEDLHTYCQNVYHYGIAWNPSDMEQRTGRIDRINSLSYRKLNQENQLNFNNKVHVFYPYMPQSVEVNQVVKLLTNIDAFTKTFNNIEERITYESKVSTDDAVEESSIPKQIIEFMTSKYDVWDFNGNTSIHLE